MGYEAYREQVFERQKQLGIFPETRELTPINPYTDATSVDGKTWPPLDVVRPWDSLSDDEKKLFCRMAEVFAGFLESHRPRDRTLARLPRQSGRVRQHDRRVGLGQRRQWRGRTERFDQRDACSSTASPTTSSRTCSIIDELGSPATYNHYPVGLGMGVQHAFQDVEAIQLRRRRRRSAGHLMAEGDQGKGRATPPVPPRDRHRARRSYDSSGSRCRRSSRASRRSRSKASASARRSRATTCRRRRSPASSRCSARGRCGTRDGRP